jgi:hypothetical protein
VPSGVNRFSVLACASFVLLCLNACGGFSYRAASSGTPTLSVGASSIAFGNVAISTQATQTLTLTSSGTAPVTIATVSTSGANFSQSGIQLPATLLPNQTATINVEFDPVQMVASTGSLSIRSDSSTGGTITLGLSGTGVAIAYQVNLSWDPPNDSTVSIAGYNVYRAISGSSIYQLINPALDTETAYADTTVQNGSAYDYYVETVDKAGVSSAPSEVLSISVP